MSLDSVRREIDLGVDKYLEEKGIYGKDRANTIQLGKAFLEFYIKDIATFLYKFDSDLVETGLDCDGKGDMNVDFIYKQENTYFIFQSKYKGQRNAITHDEIAGFAKIHSRILDTDYFKKHANSNVQDLLRDFGSKSVVRYIFITNSKISDGIKADFKRVTDAELSNFSESEIQYELRGQAEIRDDLKTANSIDAPIPNEVIIPIEKLGNSFEQHNKEWAYTDLTSILGGNEKYRTIITIIKGNELKNIYARYKESLFNYNIRGYLGPNTINKKMDKTMQETPSMFYLYNNGISAICSDFKLVSCNEGRGCQLRATNFQIINGAQTASTVGKFSDDEKLKDVRVLLRITKTEDIKKEKGLNRDIIKYNNSQTVIKTCDFRSNDDIQVFLQKKLKDYTYKATSPNKKLRYLPKRFKSIKKNDEICFDMEVFAKALYAFHYEPTKIYANSNCLFDVDQSTGGMYWKIFGNKDGEECTYYPDQELKEKAAIALLWLYLNDKIKEKAKCEKKENKETVVYQSYLAKWHFFWAYGYIIKNLYSTNESNESAKENTWVNKIHNGNAFNSDGFVDRWFESIADKIQEKLEEEQGANDDDVKKGFNFKNWLRTEKDFDKLKIRFKPERLKKTEYPL